MHDSSHCGSIASSLSPNSKLGKPIRFQDDIKQWDIAGTIVGIGRHWDYQIKFHNPLWGILEKPQFPATTSHSPPPPSRPANLPVPDPHTPVTKDISPCGWQT